MELTDIFIISLVILVIIIVTSKKREKYENIVPFPRIIHQCYLGLDNPQMPEKWGKNHEKWKEIHPDWEIILWNDESVRELIAELDDSFMTTYDNFPHWVQKADAARPFILKKYGGVYIDLDTYPNNPIDNLLSTYEVSPLIEVITGPGSGSANYSNWLMASKKNSAFWDLTIKQMKLKPVFSKISKHTEIMWTTGPMMISNAAKKYGKDKVVAIDTKLLSDCSLCDSEEICKEKSLYIVDQHESSWHSSDSSFFNSVYCAFN